MGIEPTLFAWEAKVLPLNYTRRKLDYRSDLPPASKPRMPNIQSAEQTLIIFSVIGLLRIYGGRKLLSKT